MYLTQKWQNIMVGFALTLMLSGCAAEKHAAPKQSLGVFSSLPLFWAEGGVKTALESSDEPAPIRDRLAENFEALALDNFDNISEHRLLLLAQPRALTPEELVKLDRWVRGGGNAVILADPALKWESSYPLGDSRRPAFTTLLTPLFKYWGLELTLNMKSEAITAADVGGYAIEVSADGKWEQAKLDGNCTIAAKGLVANCKLGGGEVVLMADADMLDPAIWSGPQSWISDGDRNDNMKWLMSELTRLSSAEK